CFSTELFDSSLDLGLMRGLETLAVVLFLGREVCKTLSQFNWLLRDYLKAQC
ncbi:uncharacterized protein A4U43_C01F18720, partial [Asparagus officinalis]